MDLNGYQSSLGNYLDTNANYQNDGGYGPWGEVSGGSGYNPGAYVNNQKEMGSNYKGWLSTLFDGGEEYNNLVNANYATKSRQNQAMFAAAAGGMYGLGSLGAAGAEAALAPELAGATAESFPVYSGNVALSDIPGLAGGAGAVAGGAEAFPVYGGESTLSDIPGLAPTSGGGGAQFGSPEQRASDYAAGYGSTDGVTAATPTGTGTNPYLDTMKQVLGFSGKTPLGQVTQGVRLGSNLLDMYNTYQNKRRNQGQVDNLNSLYSQNSPYAQQLNKTLTRAYAASGRRSDIGGRQVELQAKLAEMNSRLAPELNTLNNQQGMYNNRFLKSGLQFADQSGLLDRGFNSLAGLFGG